MNGGVAVGTRRIAAIFQPLWPWRAFIPVFMTWFVAVMLPGPVVGQEEDLQELYRYHHQISAEYEKVKARYHRLAKTDDPERVDVEIQLSRLQAALDRINEKIHRDGGTIPDEQSKLEVESGSPVAATDVESGAVTTRPAGTPCDAYPLFVRPETSAYRLPPMDRQSGHKRKLAKQLLQTETLLINHLVKCEAKWTRKAVLEWAATRHALAGILIDLEIRYAMAFTIGFNAEESRMIGKAFENSPELRKLFREIPELYEKYIDLSAQVDRLLERFKFAPDVATRFSLASSIEMVRQAYETYIAAENRYQQFKGPEMELLKRARESRKQRGLRKISSLYPDLTIRFRFHKINEFVTTDSSLIGKLLGKTGFLILDSESMRRRKAVGSGNR